MDAASQCASSSPSLPSSPLSVLSQSPSLSPSPLALDASGRYPSPCTTETTQPDSAPPTVKAAARHDDVGDEIIVKGDGPPPAKRRKVVRSKERTTEHLHLAGRGEQSEAQLDRLLTALRKKKKIVVIAGAGISVSAGIPDFRSSTGLFATVKGQYKMKGSGKHLFDASVYRHDSSTSSFHDMVRELAHATRNAEPTPFHHMLASLASEGRLMRLYSQNVDCIDTSLPPLATNVPLNPKGPWPTTVQLHGGLEKMVCSKCGNLDQFNASLFDGPEPPLCERCEEMDQVRTSFAGKRSHGIGRLRPRIVLYNEYNPDEDAIGMVSKADLRRVPDAVFVVGTSLKIPGVRRLVKELCQVTRSRRDGFTAWLNIDPEPPGAEFKDCWDLVVRGKCDDVAELLNLPHWDEQDIGESYMVTGDEEKEERRQRGLSRDRIDVLLERKNVQDVSSGSSADMSDDVIKPEPSLVDKVQGIPTPSASPRSQSPLPSKQPANGRKTQSKLFFAGQTQTTKPATTTAARATKPAKKPRQPKKEATKPQNSLPKTFKATKSSVGVLAKSSRTPKKLVEDPASSDLSSPPSSSMPQQDYTGLPSLRPQASKLDAPFHYRSSEENPGHEEAVAETEEYRRRASGETISPSSKPRSMGHLID